MTRIDRPSAPLVPGRTAFVEPGRIHKRGGADSPNVPPCLVLSFARRLVGGGGRLQRSCKGGTGAPSAPRRISMARRGSLPFRLFSSRGLAVASVVVLAVSALPSGIAAASNGNANFHLDKTVASVAVSPQLA